MLSGLMKYKWKIIESDNFRHRQCLRHRQSPQDDTLVGGFMASQQKAKTKSPGGGIGKTISKTFKSFVEKAKANLNDVTKMTRGAYIIVGTAVDEGAATKQALSASSVLIADDISGVDAFVYDITSAGKGNANYLGPLSYTYEHPSQNPIHNKQKSPEPNETPSDLKNVEKWLIGRKLIYEIYDEYKLGLSKMSLPNVIRQDKVVQPQIKQYIKRK